MKNKRLLLLFSLILSVYTVFGQCCSAGNPAGGDGTHSYLNKHQFKFQLFYDQSLSRQYYQADKPIEMDEIEYSSYKFINLGLQYALNEKITFQSDFGYYIEKLQSLNLAHSTVELGAGGFGDLTLQGRYLLYQSIFPEKRWTIGIGARIPVGAFHESIDGVQIPISLQPSGGALKFQASTYYFYKPLRKSLSWFAFALYEHSNTIREGYLVHHYGDYVQISGGCNKHFKERWDVSSRLKTEWRGKDIRDENVVVESSGSVLLMLAPAVSYQIPGDWFLIVSMDIPLYKYVQGMQLTKFGSFQVGISKRLN